MYYSMFAGFIFKTFAKVVYQKGIDKKQFIKKEKYHFKIEKNLSEDFRFLILICLLFIRKLNFYRKEHHRKQI